MTKQRNDYKPCSDLDLRSAILRSTHERLKEMDNKGIPTVDKFGQVLGEERKKFRTFGEAMAKKGTCSVMTWEELKKAANEHAKGVDKPNKTK